MYFDFEDGHPDYARGPSALTAREGVLLSIIVHLIAIPVTNASVNPARSTAAAIFAETGAIGQLWLFWVAPLLGAALGALIWRYLLAPGESPAGIGRPD